MAMQNGKTDMDEMILKLRAALQATKALLDAANGQVVNLAAENAVLQSKLVKDDDNQAVRKVPKVKIADEAQTNQSPL